MQIESVSVMEIGNTYSEVGDFGKNSGACVFNDAELKEEKQNSLDDLDPCCREKLQQLEDAHRVVLKYFGKKEACFNQGLPVL